MFKTYVYESLTFKATDDTRIDVSVELVTDGSVATTSIYASKKSVKEIIDSGTRYVGLAKDLRSAPLIITSKIDNPIPEEDTITVKYKINNKVIQVHTNPKSEADQVLVVVMVSIIP